MFAPAQLIHAKALSAASPAGLGTIFSGCLAVQILVMPVRIPSSPVLQEPSHHDNKELSSFVIYVKLCLMNS